MLAAINKDRKIKRKITGIISFKREKEKKSFILLF